MEILDINKKNPAHSKLASLAMFLKDKEKFVTDALQLWKQETDELHCLPMEGLPSMLFVHHKTQNSDMLQDYDFTRTVLIEKFNEELEKIVGPVRKSEWFYTEVYPIGKNEYLIFQESIIAGTLLFNEGNTNKPSRKIVIRGFIVSTEKREYAKLTLSYRTNLNYTLNMLPKHFHITLQRALKDTIMLNTDFYHTYDDYVSGTRMFVIPESAKFNYIKALVTAHNSCKQIRKEYERTELKDAQRVIDKYETELDGMMNLPEDFPIFDLQKELSTAFYSLGVEQLINGTFMPFLCKREHFRKTMEENGKKSLLNAYCSYWEHGLWNKSTNRSKDLNKHLNS